MEILNQTQDGTIERFYLQSAYKIYLRVAGSVVVGRIVVVGCIAVVGWVVVVVGWVVVVVG